MNYLITPFDTGEFMSHDGSRIYYETHGEGEPLILIYGLACLINHWHHQVEYFRKSHRVVVFDLRGHHRSSFSGQEISIDACAKDVLALIDYLNIEKATIAAHSLGVPIALACYREALKKNCADKIEKFIFVNGFYQNPIRKMFGLNVVEPIFETLRKLHAYEPQVLQFLWKQVLNNPITILTTSIFGGFNLKLTSFKDVQIYVTGLSLVPLQVFTELLKSATLYDGSKELRQVQCPVLIIGGEKDHVTPEYIQQEMQHLLPKAELHIIPYGSHCTQLDFPDYVNLRIEKFLKDFFEAQKIDLLNN